MSEPVPSHTAVNQSLPGKCPVCNSADTRIFFEVGQMPVHCNRLWERYDDAIDAPKGDLRLAFCQHCGHVFNTAFDPELVMYSAGYENSLHFSPHFQAYANSIAHQLIERYDLHHKEIIEIGSGQGDFLALLCEQGDNHGIGFDPSFTGSPAGAPGSTRVDTIRDYYSENYAHFQADLICCRQTLEHIYNPAEFLATVRRSIGDRTGTVVFFEVPNVRYTLHGLSIWDVIYEHYSFFSAPSLRYLFTSNGFQVLHLEETFGGQYLTIEAIPVPDGSPLAGDSGNEDGIAELSRDVDRYRQNFTEKVGYWQSQLASIRMAGKCAVVWSAGSKGVTFLNTLKTPGAIQNVIDINPRKHNRYIAGSGHLIISPDKLSALQPDVVIVMNPVYLDEIRQDLHEKGLSPELMVVNE